MNHCNCQQSTKSLQLNTAGSTTSPFTLPTNTRLETIHVMGGTGQISRIMAVDFTIQATARGDIVFQYNVPRPGIPPGGSHCSDVRVHFELDGVEFYTSEWLGYETRNPQLPLNSGVIVYQGVSQGSHTLTLLPEGRYGGCNTGRLFAWDGTLIIFE